MKQLTTLHKGLFFIVVLMVAAAGSVFAYSIILPDIMPSPILPYEADADHYSGPACVQMILNSDPSVSCRQLHSQSTIYTSILGHNSESTLWFSGPDGIEGALEDPIFSPCGNWVDYSHTDKDYVMGKVAYWMDHQRYLTPVSIGPDEHWVNIFCLQTDGVPDWYGTVDIDYVYFYDPMPGSDSIRIASYTTWSGSTELWGSPHSNPASAWNNKYIAIIEPPRLKVKLKLKKWIIEGKILPPKIIKEYYYRWQKELERNDQMPKQIQLLYRNPPIMTPELINAGKYLYYLIPYEKNQNMAAVFNAYTGEFEEFAFTEQKREYCFDKEIVAKNLARQLEEYKLILLKINELELLYDPYMSKASRFAPVWKAQVVVKRDCCKEYYLYITMDSSGRIINGLGDLENVKQ